MSVTASAPGKLVLFGDHAAVYGYPCLVTAVDVRFGVTIRLNNTRAITIDTPDLRASDETYAVDITQLNARNRRETAFVEAALKRLFDQSPPTSGYDLTTAGPRATYGLGSSSAITVATIAAVNEQMGLKLSLREIFDLAYAAVLDVQGTGSGVDIAAAVYGGTVYYVKGGETLEPLALDTLPIVIGYSGEKVSTTNLIAEVASLRVRQPEYIDSLLTMLGDISVQARTEMLQANWPAVGDLMNIHQHRQGNIPARRAAAAIRRPGSFRRRAPVGLAGQRRSRLARSCLRCGQRGGCRSYRRQRGLCLSHDA
jgi:mevalonate kinase